MASAVRDLEAKFESDPELFAPGRQLLSQGKLTKKNRLGKGDERFFFLFTDLLAYASWTKKGQFSLHHKLPINTAFSVRDIADEEGKPVFRFEISSSKKSFIVWARSREEKAGWLRDLRAAAGRGKTFGEAKAAPINTPLAKRKGGPAWVPDEQRNNCVRCRAKFSSGLLGKSKHHCRYCGEVVCGSCLTKVPVPQFGYNDPVFVCVSTCYAKARPADYPAVPPKSSAPAPKPRAAPAKPKPKPSSSSSSSSSSSGGGGFSKLFSRSKTPGGSSSSASQAPTGKPKKLAIPKTFKKDEPKKSGIGGFFKRGPAKPRPAPGGPPPMVDIRGGGSSGGGAGFARKQPPVPPPRVGSRGGGGGGARFCSECGTPRSSGLFCTNCGKKF